METGGSDSSISSPIYWICLKPEEDMWDPVYKIKQNSGAGNGMFPWIHILEKSFKSFQLYPTSVICSLFNFLTPGKVQAERSQGFMLTDVQHAIQQEYHTVRIPFWKDTVASSRWKPSRVWRCKVTSAGQLHLSSSQGDETQVLCCLAWSQGIFIASSSFSLFFLKINAGEL